jgi:hypothetical protein
MNFNKILFWANLFFSVVNLAKFIYTGSSFCLFLGLFNGYGAYLMSKHV